MTDLEFKKQVLDTKSASFCAAKWYNATIWLGSGQTTSPVIIHLHMRIPLKTSKSIHEAIHNTVEKNRSCADAVENVRQRLRVLLEDRGHGCGCCE
jgi:hypothetical protein